MRKFRNIVMMFALILAVSLCGCYDSPLEGADRINIQSPVQLDDSTVQGMNDSLTQLFAQARARGYTKYLKHSYYTVVVRNDCQPAPESGVMSWQEYVPGYGLTWQAEQVRISSNTVQSFQICKDTPQTMFNTTRYGAEHIILYFNDRPEFERTKIHSTPELGHPIIR